MRKRSIATAITAALLLGGSILTAPQAVAEGERRGNWDLYVDAGGCAYDWQDQAWCGPSLVVHANMYLLEDDRYSASMRLIGVDGDVPLQYARTPYTPGRGASAVDPNYWGPAFSNRVGSAGMPPGEYGVTLSVDVSGRWSCSIYSEDVCNFLRPKSANYVWLFTWDGTSIQVPVTPLVQSVDASVIGRKTPQPWVRLDAAVAPDTIGTPVKFQRKTDKGTWKTIATKKSKILGYASYLDKKAPKAKKVTYRIFAGTEPEFALTVTVRTQ